MKVLELVAGLILAWLVFMLADMELQHSMADHAHAWAVVSAVAVFVVAALFMGFRDDRRE